MKLAWLTDIHLNFIDQDARQKFYQDIIHSECDGVLISGDIAEAPCVVDILNEMVDYISKPIYFILGNHDYYRGQIQAVRDAMLTMMHLQIHDQLFWLPGAGIQQLNNNTILLGQDGWADGRLGNYQNSRISLNDSRMIADLFQEKILGKFHLFEKMQQLADADAILLQNNLIQAISKNPKKIIVLTHVPPFKEACLHNKKISDDDWLPYFSSKVVGDVLMKVAEENPAIEFLVLCGHTHSEAQFQPISNLSVEVGEAEYAKPKIQKIIFV
ncbi:MAG: metallophosphoesterase [Gammaproteobacteria bacterium]|nr:metallophosphoesterase [Gammaproteobacteria bacterium]